MANHEVRDAFPDGGSTSADNIQQKLAGGFKWTPASAAAVNATDLTGLTVRALELDGVTFVYDPLDNTSAHDGITVCVSSDGKRFIATELSPRQFVNVAAIRNAPLGSEAAGDKLIVGAAPTGAFAGHANELTVLSGTGDWVFVAPEVGQETFVVALESKYHYGVDAAWHAGTGPHSFTDGEIGARPKQFPFGESIEETLAVPPADLIAQNDGTAEGDLTGAGGLAALFDTTESQAGASAAQKTSATSGYGGKQFSAAKRIEYAAFIPSSDLGFAGAGATNVTLQLYGWAGASAPTDDADLVANGTLLGSLGPFSDDAAPTATRYVGSDDRDTEWPRAYGRLVRGTSGTIYCAELKFYEPAELTPGAKWIVGADAIGPWAGEENNIAEAEAGKAFYIHTVYDGARVFCKGCRQDLQFDAVTGEWRSGGGTFRKQVVEFTAAGQTFSKADYPGLFAVEAECFGAGGNGATGANGGGGGGGGYSWKWIDAADLMADESVDGSGAVSFGVHCSANAGTNGIGATPGTGGTATGGHINVTGTPGAKSPNTDHGGLGGFCYRGGAGGPGGLNTAAGVAGMNYGGGGGGGGANAYAGGTGGAGAVRLTLHIRV